MGETLFNTQGRVQGACDSPLTDLGIQQALLVKDYFNENSIWFDSVLFFKRKNERQILLN